MLASVIVDLAVWSLDRELTYEVPEELTPRVAVGSVVRVPLRNRRVRGWVVGFEEASSESVVPIAMVSGRGPVFDEALLEVARQLARRYVHPLSNFLSLFTPPRLGRRTSSGQMTSPGASEALPGAPRGSGKRTLIRLGANEDPLDRYSAEIDSHLASGEGAIVVVPEVREGSSVLSRLAQRFAGEAAVVHSGLDPAARSRALWEVAEGKRRLVLGGRGAVFAPHFRVGTIIIHQEHDPSLKDQRSPYYDARVVAAMRADASGSSLILASGAPSIETVHMTLEWNLEQGSATAGRTAWPQVELVEPARRRLPERIIGAIIQAYTQGQRVMILLPRVRSTGSGPGPEDLKSYLSRVVPNARITRADRPGLDEASGALQEALQGDVVIATEAALAEVERPAVATAVALGVDGLFQRPQGRAAEDAFQTLWGLGSLVTGRSPRGRMLIETRNRDHHVLQAIVRGEYAHFAARELAARREAEVPPFKKLIRVQVDGRPTPALMERVKSLPGTRVLGPSEGGGLGWQMLLKISSLEAMLDPLKEIASSSEQGVLVEVDPKDW